MAVEDNPGVTGRELLLTAMKMEEMNAKLYGELSKKLKDKDAANLFDFLAQEEEKHKKIFAVKLSENKEILSDQAMPDHIQVLLYYYKQQLYTPDVLQDKLAKLTSLENIFEFAISMELDHILYYQEIKSSIVKPEQFIVDSVIDEERRHFLRLVQYRKAKGF